MFPSIKINHKYLVNDCLFVQVFQLITANENFKLRFRSELSRRTVGGWLCDCVHHKRQLYFGNCNQSTFWDYEGFNLALLSTLRKNECTVKRRDILIFDELRKINAHPNNLVMAIYPLWNSFTQFLFRFLFLLLSVISFFLAIEYHP